MAKKDKKLLVALLWHSAAEFKLTLIALFLLCTITTFLHFAPSSFSASNLRLCISNFNAASDNSTTDAVPVPVQVQPLPSPAVDRVLPDGVIKRSFNTYGWAAYNFISMSGYRGGHDTFSIVGISSKPLQIYGRPSYLCEWIPLDPTRESITTSGSKILPDWGYGRVYTTLVITCKFSVTINADNSGGKLILHASSSGGGDTSRNLTDTIETVVENPGAVDFDLYDWKSVATSKYDYLYCGSSLFGNLSPQRTREWIAYHVKLFGERSHFVLHDAGGVHEEVMEVLRPWIELGYVTLHDIRDQERFDGYYHNQFMVVNDCLLRYKFMTKWMFFFDVDEFLYVPPKTTIQSVLDSMSRYTQFTIQQVPMSSQICFSDNNPARTYRSWGFEKLVYRDVKKVPRMNRKYAVRPRNVFATGVHMSKDLKGKTFHGIEGKIKYFHYHGSISQRREPCRHLFNSTQLMFENNPYVLDSTLQDLAASVKKFELKMIGDKLIRTRQ